MRIRRRVLAVALLATLVCATLSFPRGWGPRLVERQARQALQQRGWPSAACTIVSISPWRIATGPLRLDSTPDSPSARALVVSYSPRSLWRHQLTAIRIDGLRIALQNSTNGMAVSGLPSTPPTTAAKPPPSTTNTPWSVGTVILTSLQIVRADTPGMQPGASLAEGTLALTPDGQGRHQVGASGTLLAAPASVAGWIDLGNRDAILEASLGPAELATVQARLTGLLPGTNALPQLRGIGRLQGRAHVVHGKLDSSSFAVAADRLTIATATASANIQPLDLSGLLSWSPGRPRAAIRLHGAGTLHALDADALPAGLTRQVPLPFATALQLIPTAAGWDVALQANAHAPLVASAIGSSVAGLELSARGQWPDSGPATTPWHASLALQNFSHLDGGLSWHGDALRVDASLLLTPDAPPTAHGSLSAAGIHLQSTDRFSLSNAAAQVEWTWTPGIGLTIPGTPSLSWDHATVMGMDVRTGPLKITGTGTTFVAAMPLTIAGSAVQPQLLATVEASDPLRLVLEARILPTRFATGDTLLQLSRTVAAAESCDGEVAGSAALDWSSRSPARVTINLTLRDGNAVNSNRLWSVHGLRTELHHAGSLPLRLTPSINTHFDNLAVAGIAIEGGHVQWRWQPGELFVERADLAWCGGWLRAYALRLDTANPTTDCILYIDRLDLGRLLKLFRVLESEGTGILYGRVPIRYDHGRVFLSDGFIYSLPGQGGTLSIKNTRVIEDTLIRSGLKPEIRKNVLAALRGLRYSVFRVDLKPGVATDSDLHVTISGDAIQKGLPPINLDMNVRGPLENLLNLGLQVNKVGH